MITDRKSNPSRRTHRSYVRDYEEKASHEIDLAVAKLEAEQFAAALEHALSAQGELAMGQANAVYGGTSHKERKGLAKKLTRLAKDLHERVLRPLETRLGGPVRNPVNNPGDAFLLAATRRRQKGLTPHEERVVMAAERRAERARRARRQTPPPLPSARRRNPPTAAHERAYAIARETAWIQLELAEEAMKNDDLRAAFEHSKFAVGQLQLAQREAEHAHDSAGVQFILGLHDRLTENVLTPLELRLAQLSRARRRSSLVH